jgi:hypothetical protein
MWQMKTGKNLRPTIGQIMVGGIMKQSNLGETRLHKILITESAHLVWRLRNERVIQGSGSKSVDEIRNRWLKMINNRLDIDCAMTNVFKYEKKALRVSLVKATWTKTLKGERTLAKYWPKRVGVLVFRQTNVAIQTKMKITYVKNDFLDVNIFPGTEPCAEVKIQFKACKSREQNELRRRYIFVL